MKIISNYIPIQTNTMYSHAFIFLNSIFATLRGFSWFCSVLFLKKIKILYRMKMKSSMTLVPGISMLVFFLNGKATNSKDGLNANATESVTPHVCGCMKILEK